jgi:two-component system cell cycle sensor histidine kinase/response regulator CckA
LSWGQGYCFSGILDVVKRKLRALIVEDSEDDAALVVRELRRCGYALEFERVFDADSTRAAIAREWDIVLSDWSMPQFGALGALEIVRRADPDMPFLIVSGTIGEDTAVEALRAGAADFLLKDRLARLGPAIERELREREGRRARRRAEGALRASEARYRILFDNSPLPMWVLDIETMAFLAVNEAAVRHYGYSRDEFARMTLSGLRPEPSLAPHAEPVLESSSASDGDVWEHRRKDGSVIIVEIKGHDFELEGRPARLVVANDITERRRALEVLRKTEEQLRHAQKMEAVGRLAGGVAHDFNNMLSIILSYCELMIGDLPSEDRMRDDLEEVRKAARRAADLTKQLLTFSRQQVTELRILDVNDLLTDLDKMLRRLVGEDVELVTLTSKPVGKVKADQGHVEQVVMNLVINARDAMPKGGKLTIETADVVLDETYAEAHLGARPGPHVMLAVSDTGMGMDKATQARIFEPFFTTKEVGKGTGLGLSTVFGIVQQSAGSIWLYSEPGRGTTFKVYLPRTDEPVVSSGQYADPPTLRGTETILLAEDEEQLRNVTRGILTRNGYTVIEARSADEAWATAEGHKGRIDLLLTDVVMPGMSGADLAAKLQARRPDLRVLCMSGYTDEAVVRHGILGSGMAFLQKPLTPATLLHKVRTVLDAGGPSAKKKKARA